jgi:hypothetical protein
MAWNIQCGNLSSRCIQATGVFDFDVRFGSKADMCGAIGHVRITPESGHPASIERRAIEDDRCS